MTMGTILTLALMYMVPLGILSWLFSIKPGYGVLAACVIAAAFGVGGLTILTG